MMNERPTPLTDALVATMITKPWWGDNRLANHARRLERVAAELAEALVATGYGGTCTCADPFCLLARAALRHYEELKGGGK